jgi:hypothetical protein
MDRWAYVRRDELVGRKVVALFDRAEARDETAWSVHRPDLALDRQVTPTCRTSDGSSLTGRQSCHANPKMKGDQAPDSIWRSRKRLLG